MKRSLKAWLALSCVLSLAACVGRVGAWASLMGNAAAAHSCCAPESAPAKPAPSTDCCAVADLHARVVAPAVESLPFAAAPAPVALPVLVALRTLPVAVDRLRAPDPRVRAHGGLSPPPAALA